MQPAAVGHATVRFVSSRAKLLASIAVVLVAFYLLAVTPIRTYFQHQAEMRQAEERYEVLASTNKELQQRAQQLQSDAEIKKLARERYELVEPGQQAWAVMNPSPTVTEQAKPASEEKKHGFVERTWDKINPWN